MRTRVSKAFTLVEILIVVVILGILAAIVIPQFTNASQEAQIGNVQTQLQTMRSQIELFRVRNNGNPPALVGTGAAAFADLITRQPQAQYVRTAPVNPRNKTPTSSPAPRSSAPSAWAPRRWTPRPPRAAGSMTARRASSPPSASTRRPTSGSACRNPVESVLL